MTSLIKAIITYVLVCFVFVNIELLILYFFFQDNITRCFFSTNNEQTKLVSRLKQQKFSPVGNSIIFALILSSQKTQTRRKAVRDTWSSSTYNLAFNHVFVLAQEEQDESLLIEKDLYQDILILPDAGKQYRNLTSKVLYGIIYCYKNFNYKYLLKTDDDSFVNVAAILDQIKIVEAENNGSSTAGIYAGKPMKAVNIFTQGHLADLKFKRLSSLQKYPPYMQGAGYILSRSITGYITQAHQKYGLWQTVAEDVTMGMWLLSLNVTRIDWSKMITQNLRRGRDTVQNTNITVDVCRKNPPQIILHRVSEDYMLQFYQKLLHCVNS